MKRKAIKVDWDDLEEAFSNPDVDATSYLDRVTGRVVLEGEEDDDFDEDEAAFENPMAVANAQTAVAREDPTRIPIRPPARSGRSDGCRRFSSRTRVVTTPRSSRS